MTRAGPMTDQRGLLERLLPLTSCHGRPGYRLIRDVPGARRIQLVRGALRSRFASDQPIEKQTHESSRKEATVDPAGAEQLRLRIEQQAHWRQARSVLDGRQPAMDPDGSDLDHLESGLRVYASRIARGQVVRQHKRLIDGLWISETVAETASTARHGSRLEELTQVA